jgi:hypothetical protein
LKTEQEKLAHAQHPDPQHQDQHANPPAEQTAEQQKAPQ